MVDGEVDAGKMRGTDKSRERRKTREPNNKKPDDVFFPLHLPAAKTRLIDGFKVEFL